MLSKGHVTPPTSNCRLPVPMTVPRPLCAQNGHLRYGIMSFFPGDVISSILDISNWAWSQLGTWPQVAFNMILSFSFLPIKKATWFYYYFTIAFCFKLDTLCALLVLYFFLCAKNNFMSFTLRAKNMTKLIRQHIYIYKHIYVYLVLLFHILQGSCNPERIAVYLSASQEVMQ